MTLRPEYDLELHSQEEEEEEEEKEEARQLQLYSWERNVTVTGSNGHMTGGYYRYQPWKYYSVLQNDDSQSPDWNKS